MGRLLKNRKDFLSRVLLLVLLWIALSGFSFSNPFTDNMKNGNRAFAKEDYEKALEFYVAAKDKDPANSVVYYNMGNAHYMLKDFDSAIANYRQAAIENDKELSQWAMYNIGNALFNKEEYKEAVEAYIEALKLDPDDKEAKLNLELALRMLRQQQEEEQKDSCDNPEDNEDKEKEDKEDKSDSGKNDSSDQNQENNKEKSSKSDQNQEEENQENQSSVQKSQDEPENENNAAASSMNEEEKSEDEKNNMLISPSQALQILDALDKEEQAEQRNQLRAPPTDEQPDEDW